MAEIVEATVAVRVAGLTADHPVNVSARDELFDELRSVPELRAQERDGAERAGKGALVEIVLGLGSTASVAALVKLVQLWLTRDRHRSLTISIDVHKTGKVIKIEGDNISVATLTEVLGLPSIEPGDQSNSGDEGE